MAAEPLLADVPIDIDEFEAADAADLRDGAVPLREDVVEYLSFHPDLAYSRAELQTALDVDAIHLLHVLTLLEQEGVVRHKGGYWAIDGATADPDG